MSDDSECPYCGAPRKELIAVGEWRFKCQCYEVDPEGPFDKIVDPVIERAAESISTEVLTAAKVEITRGHAAEILAVHNRLQAELTEQDRTIEGLSKKIAKLEAEREGWQEPIHFCEDI